jgi:hypothetical protein
LINLIRSMALQITKPRMRQESKFEWRRVELFQPFLSYGELMVSRWRINVT